ncbi:hypothetical protein [Halorarius litoreus]|uniref:hypothetical protein n=1 Tax=Halorarius litoreus TaxID=2962676 RepID=UPI0020CFB1BC|nr:hypothetical protein [Halorarius litoreus]
MPLTGPSELASFDGVAAMEAARDVVGDDLLSFVEFTSDAHRPLFVADEIVELYRDEDHLQRHYDRVLAHLNMDFLERDTYEKTLLPNAGRVRAIVTRMEGLTLLRMLAADEGLYVALAPDADVEPVIDAVEPVMGTE